MLGDLGWEAAAQARTGHPTTNLPERQLAAALGVSTATIDRLCREPAIPFLTVGDSRRFDLVAVRQALEARAAEEVTVLDQAPPEVSTSGVRRLTKNRR